MICFVTHSFEFYSELLVLSVVVYTLFYLKNLTTVQCAVWLEKNTCDGNHFIFLCPCICLPLFVTSYTIIDIVFSLQLFPVGVFVIQFKLDQMMWVWKCVCVCVHAFMYFARHSNWNIYSKVQQNEQSAVCIPACMVWTNNWLEDENWYADDVYIGGL